MRETKGRKIWLTSGALVLVVALIAALVLTACAGGGGGNGGGGGGGGGTPHPWIVRFGYPTTGLAGFIGIDPGTTTAAIVGMQTSEGLCYFDPNTKKAAPGLATSWEVAPDRSYVDYTIRQGVKFQNGDLMTVEDVKFSYDRMKDAAIVGTGAETAKRFWGDIEIIGADKVRVHINQWAWSLLTSTPVIVPKNYIEKVGWEEWADKPVTTGPFKLVDWERDVSVHLVKAFPEEGHWYWGTDTPNYDELYILSVIEPATRMAMLKAGELDASHVPASNVPVVKNDPKLTLALSKYSSSWSLIFYDMGFPETPSPLLDPNVRKAVSLAIDREGIGENVLAGTYEPWGSYWGPNCLGYRYRVPDPYDPDEAKKLLAEAGYPDGFDTVFVYPMDQQVASLAVIASLATAGIRATAKGYEPTTWGTMLNTNQHTGMGYIHMPTWGGAYYPDWIWSAEANSWAAQVSRDIPEIKDIFNQMLTATTEEELKQTVWAAEDLVFEKGWKIPVFAIHGSFAYGPTVESWPVGWPGSEYTQSLIILKYKG